MTNARLKDLLEELNDLEQRYGRVLSEADPNYDASGEAQARIDILKADLERLGVRLRWSGQRYDVVSTQGS